MKKPGVKYENDGRPKLPFNFELFRSLCEIHCTLKEIAGTMKVSEDTVQRRCKEQYGRNFEEVWEEFNAPGRVSLRRIQLKHAEKSPGMAIFLGKVYLKQREETDPRQLPSEEEVDEQDDAIIARFEKELMEKHGIAK
jgi:AraC-like DNA-binding protein